ncbi:MAG: hypothetical protein EXX96DRAFT_477218 [Benjaminiella poitrasii]|nr:MAG: hypothetical protein EXX96DRAFT_477218 [Benjaminiella poitrasii]
MCVYSAVDGYVNDFHIAHYGSFALKGPGLIMVEATAVHPDARGTPQDLGLWNDSHIPGHQRLVDIIKAQGVTPGLQLTHGGRKSSMSPPFKGDYILTEAEKGWPDHVNGPSENPYAAHYPKPHMMTVQDIKATIQDFVDATIRADKAGVEVLELHGAHGCLISAFYSGNANKRTDEYGGSFENRIRFCLELVKAVRAVWPVSKPFWIRLSCTDYANPEPMGENRDGWDIYQTIRLSKELKKLGVDVIDCSSGGIISGVKYPAVPMYQVQFAEAVKREAGIATAAVGLIVEGEDAEEILQQNKADYILVGREFLRNSAFVLVAAQALNVDINWPQQYAWAVKKAPQQENSTATNGTILQLLNDTTTSPALRFAQFLQSSPDYQPIIDLLSDVSSNITLFVPFDQVYYEATGEQPPASPTDPNNNTTDGNTTNPTTTSSYGEPTSVTPSSSPLVSILPFFSSTPINSPTPQTTPLFSIPNMVNYYIPRPLNIRKANWESVTTNAACVDQFSYADIIRYHLVNGSFALTNRTMVLDSLLVNTTINKWGSGSPLIVQQGSNLTVGTGLGNDAHILSNRTIQASNGVIYVIDKILVPPVSSADTLKILPNATFFSWFLSRSSFNATLDTNNNMTFFVPTNDALVNIDFTVLNNETIDNFVKSHIVPGVYYTTNLTDQPVTVNSLAGTNFTLTNPDPSNNQTATGNTHLCFFFFLCQFK